MIEEISRAELGLPPQDSNIELVDMEVSSGASSSSSIITAESSNHSVLENINDVEQITKKLPLPPSPLIPVSSLTNQISSNELQTSNGNVLFWPTAPSFIHLPNTSPKQLNSSFAETEKILSKSVLRSPSIISDNVSIYRWYNLKS